MDKNDDSSPTILVVDDVEDTRATLRAFLEHHHYGIVEAVNGQQAVEVALREHPDLILMDLFMPEKDGIGAITSIREYDELRDVPIVAISAYGVLGILPDEALKAGCNEYVSKPVEFEELRALVERLLKPEQKKEPSQEGSEEHERYERYVAAYDAAQQLHTRRTENSRAEARMAEMFSAQGEALHQIKNFARVGFMLVPDATEKAFEQLWREAFQAE